MQKFSIIYNGSTLSSVFGYLGLLLLAAFAGLIAVTGSPMLIGGFAALILGMALMFSPQFLFFAALIFALVISGLAEFYLRVGQANWGASGIVLLLGGAALLSALGKTRSLPTALTKSVMPAVLAYVLALLVASLLNGISPLQFLVGVRNYLPFIGVFIACRYLATDSTLSKMPTMLVGIALLQLPFCLHQALVVAPMRQHSLAAIGGGAEAIVGTFGGDPLGGGYTGEMAVFVLIAACISFAVKPQGRLVRIAFRLMPIAALACIGMAETKIVFVLAPIMLVVVFLEELRSSPTRMFALLLGGGAMLGILAGIYAWRFWSAGSDEFWHAFTYSFDPNFMVDRLHRGRVAALVHWWNNNILDFDFLHAMFGYGMASTLEASRVLGEGNAVRSFGYGLDAHAANKLLWDSGLTGFLMFCVVIGRTALNAHRIVASGLCSGNHLGMLKVARGAMFGFAVMLPYQVSMVGGAPMQVLFWLFVGYVEYCRCTKHSS
ncbi:MAG: hypothetical protein KKE51_06655 [Gammaproteobacteria bacterium]|nr:hypothetical protein [Gammaproteobacteria bacterium]MBU2435904.1 hypothetical protein [Gammaproteobacteria bacterium]MBU2449315.1 hypothetical protein [Gammaproteobacteria bacterium]